MKNGLLLGTIIGGVVAAATTIFATPKTGKEMRAKVSTKANEAYSNVKVKTQNKFAELKETKFAKKEVLEEEAVLEKEETKEVAEIQENIA